MEETIKPKRSLATTKGKDVSNREKPLVAGAGYMGGRKHYKYGGKEDK